MSGIGSITSKSLIQHLRPAAGVEAIAKTEAAAAAKLLSPGEVEAQQRFKALQDTNAMVLLPADPEALVALVTKGKLEQGQLSLHNVSLEAQQDRGLAAFVLSDEGKKALAVSHALDDALKYRTAGFGTSIDLPVSLDLHRHVQQVLVDDTAYSALMKAHAQSVEQGTAPKLIGGKPSAQFFKPSDDFFNDFQVEQFRKDVPGFAQKPLMEQKAIAALAGGVAAQFPDSVPAAIRHRVAATMVRHQAYDTPIKTEGLEVVGELRDFFHGRAILRRDGTPLRPPESLLRDGFHPDDNGVFGVGVYHANASVAQKYGLSSIDRPGAILSGKVSLGKLTMSLNGETFDVGTGDSLRFKGPFVGDYWVTKDPQRFFVTGITRYDPASTEFAKVIPDLLQSVSHAPDWAFPKLLALDPALLQRALAHVGISGEPTMKHTATLIKAARGDETARTAALKLLESSNATLQAASTSVLKSLALSLGVERLPEAQSIVRKIFKSVPKVAEEPEFIADLAIRYGGAIFGGAKLEGASEALRVAMTRGTEATETVVKGLIEAGADLQLRSIGGKALHDAARNGNTSAIKALLAAGVDPLATDASKSLALHLAAENGHSEVVKMLLPLVPDVSARNELMETPLHLMASSGNVDGVKALLAAGADVNARDSHNWTPLHNAVLETKPGLVSTLLEAGADGGARLSDGRSALYLAVSGGNQEAIQALAEAGFHA